MWNRARRTRLRAAGRLASCGALVALAGCNSVPPDRVLVKAVCDPQGRMVAFLPFLPRPGGGATLVDGVTVAQLASVRLRAEKPELKVLGPFDMQEQLKDGKLETRWLEIGQATGAELVVLGELMVVETQFSRGHQMRSGVIGYRFQVLEVKDPGKRRAPRANWSFNFPADPADAYDTRYVTMTKEAFRHEMIGFGAARLAGAFYDHLEKKSTASQLEVRWYK